MFETAKSIKAATKIMNGGTAELSNSQIVNLIINMITANQRLTKEQFAEVADKYNMYRKDKTKRMMSKSEYKEICKQIESDFSTVAPFELYCNEEYLIRPLLNPRRLQRRNTESAEKEDLPQNRDESPQDRSDSTETINIETIKNHVQKFLAKKEWEAEESESGRVLTLEFASNEVLERITVLVCFYDKWFDVRLVTHLRCPEERKTDLAKYFCQLNYDRVLGEYTLDLEDGEIGCKMAVDCSDYLPSDQVMFDSFAILNDAINEETNAIQQIISGAQVAAESKDIGEDSQETSERRERAIDKIDKLTEDAYDKITDSLSEINIPVDVQKELCPVLYVLCDYGAATAGIDREQITGKLLTILEKEYGLEDYDSFDKRCELYTDMVTGEMEPRAVWCFGSDSSLEELNKNPLERVLTAFGDVLLCKKLTEIGYNCAIEPSDLPDLVTMMAFAEKFQDIHVALSTFFVMIGSDFLNEE